MKYHKQITLKDGTPCLLRNACAEDAKAEYELFNLTHEQTDNLLCYPDENSFDISMEAKYLAEKEASPDAAEIAALVNGRIVGTAGIEAIGKKDKLKHRADFGIAIEQGWWHRGIGRALTEACIDCARQAGFSQLELSAVSTNTGALSLYESVGFVEYGRNPRGFRTRDGRWQELVLMRLELEP